MIASVPAWLTDAGTIAGAVLAIAAAFALCYRLPPVRWLVRQLREDMAEHRCAEITAVLDRKMPDYLGDILYELRPNGGQSFRDRVLDELRESREDRAEIRELVDQEIVRVKAVEQEVITNRREVE